MVSISQSNSDNDELVLVTQMNTAIAAAGVTPNANIAVLQKNIQQVVNFSMGSANYTMTSDQAQKAALLPSNGDNKTLTWPSAADGTWPINAQVLSTGLLTGPITLASQTGGTTTVVPPGIVTQVAVLPGIGAYDLGAITATQTRKQINGTLILAAGANTLAEADLGKLHVSQDAAAQTLTIPHTFLTADAVFTVTCEAAGGLTLLSDGTSVLIGSAAFVSGQSATVVREASTVNWRILR